MLRVIYEGIPVGTIPVQTFNAGSPKYWEAGAMGMLDSSGNGVVSDGTAVYGILADRRSQYPGISIATFLPSSVGNYGDESLFNQPGHGNSLFGTTNGINNIIPTNTVPTTTNLRDETGVNPNTSTRLVTMYIRGGIYGTDQFDTQTYHVNDTLYCMTDGTGRVTNVNPGSGIVVGTVEVVNDGNGFLVFKSSIA